MVLCCLSRIDTNHTQGGIIPPLYGVTTAKKPTGRLNDRYDSRSRFYLEADRLADRQKVRQHAAAGLNQDFEENESEYDGSPFVMKHGFGQFDQDHREQAIAQLNVHALADAAEDIETVKIATPKTPVKEDMSGFLALMDAIDIARDPTTMHLAEISVVDASPIAGFGPQTVPLNGPTTVPRLAPVPENDEFGNRGMDYAPAEKRVDPNRVTINHLLSTDEPPRVKDEQMWNAEYILHYPGPPIPPPNNSNAPSGSATTINGSHVPPSGSERRQEQQMTIFPARAPAEFPDRAFNQSPSFQGKAKHRKTGSDVDRHINDPDLRPKRGRKRAATVSVVLAPHHQMVGTFD
jgi:hypothetical protein